VNDAAATSAGRWGDAALQTSRLVATWVGASPAFGAGAVPVSATTIVELAVLTPL
jgi:hypothetical protein